MSANNWGICPKCQERKELNIKKLTQQIRDSYGKVSEKEYLAMTEQLEEMEQVALGNTTLREDWEIGTSADGTFEVWYGCSCQSCGFEFAFQHEEKIT